VRRSTTSEVGLRYQMSIVGGSVPGIVQAVPSSNSPLTTRLALTLHVETPDTLRV